MDNNESLKDILEETSRLDAVANETVNLNEEEIKNREAILDKGLERIKTYGLEWTIRSIDYIVNQQGYTFNQLRNCVFKNAVDELQYNLLRALVLIIKAGLVGSKQVDKSDSKKLDDRAYEILDDWTDNEGYIGILHLLLINQMEKKHFFMDTKDMNTIELLSYKNLQRDLGTQLLMNDIQDRVNQAKAM